MTITELGAISAANGLFLTDDQLEKLGSYAELLREKNQVVNLISRKDEGNIVSKHILHSLTLVFPNVKLAGIPDHANVFDLGTGGGLPGIPVKIARPDISLLLCDSIAKKIVAINEMVSTLLLPEVQAFNARAEVLAAQARYRHKFDIVITRAVAPLEDLAQWSFNLLEKNGSILALKGGNLDEEIQKTEHLKIVRSVAAHPLHIEGYNEFNIEEKKIVRVIMA